MTTPTLRMEGDTIADQLDEMTLAEKVSRAVSMGEDSHVGQANGAKDREESLATEAKIQAVKKSAELKVQEELLAAEVKFQADKERAKAKAREELLLAEVKFQADKERAEAKAREDLLLTNKMVDPIAKEVAMMKAEMDKKLTEVTIQAEKERAESKARDELHQAELKAREELLQAESKAREELLQAESKARELLQAELKAREDERDARSVWRYFQDGFSLPECERIVTISGASVNKNHQPIKNVQQKQFGVLTMTEDIDPCRKKPSELLVSGALTYATEADLQMVILKVLKDMVTASKLHIHFIAEMNLTDQKADFWVLSLNGFPIGAVEVKKPYCSTSAKEIHKSKIDENKKFFYGQLFDYLVLARSFYGLTNMLGILTNYDEWEICWLPDSDQCALSTDLNYEGNDIDPDTVDNRTLHVSEVYRRSDSKRLATALCAALKKMAKNARFTVPLSLGSKSRTYIVTDDRRWTWSKNLPQKLQLAPRYEVTSKFYLLQDFKGGADGRVWLGCDEQGHLNVLKMFVDTEEEEIRSEKLSKEVERWKKLGHGTVFKTQIIGKPTIVAPFAFHFDASQQLDTTWWRQTLSQSWSIIEDFDYFLAEANRFSAIEALQNCIERCSAANLVHEDIEWRHVALFPTYSIDENGQQQKHLTPGFIDLTRMSEVSSQTAAKDAMVSDVSERLGINFN